MSSGAWHESLWAAMKEDPLSGPKTVNFAIESKTIVRAENALLVSLLKIHAP